MSDTVKLIIEMPTEMLQEMRDNDFIDIETLNTCIKAIENGIPLDDVKAEILKRIDEHCARTIEIFDNIGKPESEV